MCSAQPVTPTTAPAAQMGLRSSSPSVASGRRASIAAAVLDPACCIRYDALSATAAQIASAIPIEVAFTSAPYAAGDDDVAATPDPFRDYARPARLRGRPRGDRRGRRGHRLALRAA